MLSNEQFQEDQEVYLTFNGHKNDTGSYVYIKDSSLLRLQKFTVEAWVKWDGVKGLCTILSKPRSDGLSKSGTGYALHIWDGEPAIATWSQSGGPRDIKSAPIKLKPIQPNVWTHIAASYDGYTSIIYVNGIQVFKQNWRTLAAVAEGSTPLYIGREFVGDYKDRVFGGGLKDIRLWNTVLSSDVIEKWKRTKSLSNHPNIMDLRGHWPLNEGVGITVKDASKNGQDGELKNGASWENVLHKKTITEKSDDIPIVPLKFSFAISYNELVIGKEIGRGAFGIVYQGTWKKHIDVAIKQLILSKPSDDALIEFKQEMEIMSRLHCPQIIQLYGIYTMPTYGIVMEYMPNGSLYSVLHSKQPLEWSVRYSIAVDITKGVAFLHSEKILHRDLKSLNVLLDKHMNAKLTDFGLAKVKTETASTSSSSSSNQVVGTLLWMAPELFKRRAQCTQKSDMYSLGMTLWELASREIPFKDASNQAIARDWIEKGEREEIPTDTPPKVSKLITFCWNAEASKRPTADEAVKQLLSAELKQEQTESANFSYRGNLGSI